MFKNGYNQFVKIILLFLLCIILTIILQSWVGEQTIYSENYRKQRLFEHEAIFENRLPEGEHWKDYGAPGTNVRIFVVYLVEYVHRLSGASINHLYRGIDSLSLFLCFIALFFYLRRWINDQFCLVGLLYTSIVFVMTYYFHNFHPWDRISLLSWIILIYLIREKKDILFGVVLAISVTIKYDVKVLPLLYFLYNYSTNNRLRVIFTTLILFMIGFGAHEVLKIMLPATQEQGFSADHFSLLSNVDNSISVIKKNLMHLKIHHVAHPTLLMFIMPCIFAVMEWKKKDRFAKASVIFSFLLFIPHLLLVNFREVRAQTMILVLLLPPALLSLENILEKGKKGNRD